MAIKIPVFLSAPTTLTKEQQTVFDFVRGCLKKENLDGRALGRTDFPEFNPLAEVFYIARSCFGGMILGFKQIEITQGVAKAKTPDESPISDKPMGTAWNQIEAGLLFAMRRPLIVAREEGITEGIFGASSSEFFMMTLSMKHSEGIREGVRGWVSRVRSTYKAA